MNYPFLLKQQKGNLHPTSLTLHFIYSFLFSSFNIEEILKDVGSETNLREKLYSELNVNLEGIRIYSEEGEFYGKERMFDHYLSPFLYLKMSYIEIKEVDPLGLQNGSTKLLRCLENQEKEPPDYFPNPISVKHSEKRIILLESGQGILDFVLEFEPLEECKYLDPLDIVYLANIGMRRRKLEDPKNRNFSLFKFERDDQELYLFKKFYDDIVQLEMVLNKIVNKSPKTNAEMQNHEKHKREIHWIETHHKLVGDTSKYHDKLHFQDPYPIICVTIPERTFGQVFLDTDQRKAIKVRKHSNFKNMLFEPKCNTMIIKELLLLLFRSKLIAFQDTTFASSLGMFSNGRLENMCSNSSVFLYLYSRSSLIIKPPENSYLNDHAKYIIPAFIETVEYLRMRWHADVIATQWLDRIIENLSKDETSFRDVLKMIIESRRDISRALSDPLSYRIGSGSMNRIYNVGKNIFRIDELEKIVIDKLSMIDVLYDKLYELEKVRELDLIEKKIREANR